MKYGVAKNWWENGGDFFNNIYLEGDNSIEGFLNSPLDLDSRTKIEVRGVARLCCLKKGDKILDCPSGYGRHSLALANMGFNVVGADINERFLTLANNSLKKTKLQNVNFIKKKYARFRF